MKDNKIIQQLDCSWRGNPADPLVQAAANKGRTVWLQNCLIELLPQLNQPSTDYQTWFDSIKSVMKQRGLTQPTQQKDYLSDIRNAIKVIDPHHPALQVVDFDTSTWVQINNRAGDRLGERKTKFIDNPDAIVKLATTLLGSYQWSEIAAGLAVVTGRRSTEVIKTARFQYKTKYSVIFTGALKRGNEPVECVFEIPTLCEAQLVIKAIANLRSQLGQEIQDLTKRQVSSRYGRAVAKKCDRYFDELVPPREDQDNLYTHLFRAVYATIASYWYCPPTVPEIEFRAAIQGHYQIIDELDPKLRRSIAAGRNYFDYRISDGQGNIDGRLGIKLSLPDVEILEQFQPAVFQADKPPTNLIAYTNTTLAQTQPNKPQIMNQSSNSANSAHANSMVIPSFFQSRLSTIAQKLGITPDQAIQALFTWTEMGLSLAEQLSIEDLTPQAIFESVEQLKATADNNSDSVEFDSSQSAKLNSHSLNQLSISIRLLSEALYNKQNSQGDKSTPQNPTTVIEQKLLDTAEHNNSPSHNNSSAKLQPNLSLPVEKEPAEPTKNSQPTSSKSSKGESSPRKISKKSLEAEQEIDRAIDAIIQFNNQEDVSHQDKWHIGVSALRKLTERGDSVIQRVLQPRKTEIEQHHAVHQIGPRHNSKGKTYPSIDEIISL
ncbi:MAG: telomere resolvase [Pleurocapsa minor HA4230-MV1]|jgi:hypothetical protein|nr:telomere resolvase [Pleurocapsa minor HA4230-MV1]